MKKTAGKKSSKKSNVSNMASSRKTKTIDLYVGTDYASDYFDNGKCYADEVLISLTPLKPMPGCPNKWEPSRSARLSTFICKAAAKKFLGGKIPPKNVQWNVKLRMEENVRVITQDMLKKRQLAAKRKRRQ